jgi:predicted PurR-regulated permease PerM
VKTWPLIGKEVFSFWAMASTNLESAIARLGPAVMDVGGWLLGVAGQVGIAVLLFLGSVIIAGVFLAYSQKSSLGANRLATRLAGDQGGEYIRAAESTIRSVAVGVLGIAFIQAMLAGIGMLVAGIPGAGVWAFIILILSITQIGGLPVLLPAAIYMFATADTVPAVLFAVWAGIVGIIDNVLRPLLLGRGAHSPLLIILFGSIGGLVVAGVVGLFVGAVILTVGYKLFLVWLEANA